MGYAMQRERQKNKDEILYIRGTLFKAIGLGFHYNEGTISVYAHTIPLQNDCIDSDSNCEVPAIPNMSWPRIMPQKPWEEAWDSSPSGIQNAATAHSKGRLDLTSRTIDNISDISGLYQRPALHKKRKPFSRFHS